MKFRLPILFGVAILFSLGVYTSTRALDPQKSTDNPSANQGESAPKTKSVPLSKSKKMSDPFNKLSQEESKVIIGKGTERAGVGKYTSFKGEGIYICKRCNAPALQLDR